MGDIVSIDFKSDVHLSRDYSEIQKRDTKMKELIKNAFVPGNPELSAAKIRALYGKTCLDFPVVDFVKRLGIEYVAIDFSKVQTTKVADNRINGYLGLYADRAQPPRIVVSENESIGHQNWTTAHELWHYMNHNDPVSKDVYYTENADDYGGKSSNDEENNANLFAAALLMPEQAFTVAYKNSLRLGRKKRVAELFQVSETAVQMRANTLGLA
ncbi:MAG: ImmA/IrrE family metallo-endopeptidase [Clostridia bacterium]|nr:ImmA/IrrE family metallo-endopeptidase [Clostridia bacterium]